MAANPSAEIAVKKAQLIWQEELLKSRTCFVFDSSAIKTDEESIH